MPLRGRTEADSVEIELIRSLNDAFVPSAIMSAGFALCGTLMVVKTGDTILAWSLAAGILASMLRLVVARHMARASARPDLTIMCARRQERRFSLSYVTFAVILGLFAARCFALDVAAVQMLATCLIVGYGAGVAAGIGLRPRIAVTSMVVAIAPSIIVGLGRFDALHVANAAMMAALLAGGINSLQRRHKRTIGDIERRLRFSQLARRDALTALPNRLALREWFDDYAAGPVAIHCLDLDGFKPVNDTYGHPVGDALLSAVAGRLSGTLRDGDLAARIGGDEFVIVQRNIGPSQEAEFLAQRLRAGIARSFRIGDHSIQVSACIGYVISGEGQDLETLIALADEALYEAKRSGRGIVRHRGDSTTDAAVT